MSRSPLAYPLNRTADTDVGGAADLQTDVMRFMAILALCLVAIFALVQSIPLTPVEPPPVEPVVEMPIPEPMPAPEPELVPEQVNEVVPEPERAVALTRPKWVPKYAPTERKPLARKLAPADPEPVASRPAPTDPEPVASKPVPVEPEQDGFTLRFASDAALTRAVAAHHVGLYALEPGRAKRMTVSESRISFWDASMPNTFHEMEAGTVPDAVLRALARTGATTENTSWGVTLPGKMKSQLDSLMQEHRGGTLIISAGGEIHWEDS